jgi:hypothetical protein
MDASDSEMDYYRHQKDLRISPICQDYCPPGQESHYRSICYPMHDDDHERKPKECEDNQMVVNGECDDEALCYSDYMSIVHDKHVAKFPGQKVRTNLLGNFKCVCSYGMADGECVETNPCTAVTQYFDLKSNECMDRSEGPEENCNRYSTRSNNCEDCRIGFVAEEETGKCVSLEIADYCKDGFIYEFLDQDGQNVSCLDTADECLAINPNEVKVAEANRPSLINLVKLI